MSLTVAADLKSVVQGFRESFCACARITLALLYCLSLRQSSGASAYCTALNLCSDGDTENFVALLVSDWLSSFLLYLISVVCPHCILQCSRETLERAAYELQRCGKLYNNIKKIEVICSLEEQCSSVCEELGTADSYILSSICFSGLQLAGYLS